MQAQSSSLIPFQFDQSHVRTLLIDDQAWFVAADVCAALDVINVSQALQRLDEDERSMFNIGRQGSTNVINESGLYSLVLSSRKPDARRFKKWVTSEVLPAIRKTGAYNVKPTEQTYPPLPEIFGSGRWLADLNEVGWPQLTRIPDDAVFAFPEDPAAMVSLINGLPVKMLPEIMHAAALRLSEAPRLPAMVRARLKAQDAPVDRLVQYVRNAKRYVRDVKYASVLKHGKMPRAKALKLMAVDAETFRGVANEAVERGLIRIEPFAFEYAGDVFVAA